MRRLKLDHMIAMAACIPVTSLLSAGTVSAQTVTIDDDCSYPQAGDVDYGLTL